ncbi:MAG TPA: efflux RND transporter periplasmic adaptor subunit [Verrucomicrobiae bacterium]|nr:efflux RND transporter periplasmic adaptor subunit [Verrucomicrobiae bacterium]
METPPVLSKPRPKKRNKLIILAIVLLAAVFIVLVVIFRHQTPPIIVQTERVARRNITETVVANGKIYPVVEVHISPEVSGEIIELPVKEGQHVKKGDLLLKINPDVYVAALNQAQASYESQLAAEAQAVANLEKADEDYTRNLALFTNKLLSESDFIGFKAARDVADAQLQSATNQVDMAKAAVDSAQDTLNRTTIVSPLDGTVTTLNSQLGERVLGTVENTGTEIMTISDLSEMEARVDVGEMDVVLIQPGQKATLDVDSFQDKKFSGIVTDVGSSAEGLDTGAATGAESSSSSSSGSQTATQFQVCIHVNEREQFRPGMSVTAEIQTRSRTNALAVPIASVTTRVLKAKAKAVTARAGTRSISTNALASADGPTNSADTKTNSPNAKKMADVQKPVDVVFVVEGNHVKAVPVKIGISDDDYWEITDGLKEGDEIVVGGYHAISRDLDDGKKIVKGPAAPTPDASP